MAEEEEKTSAASQSQAGRDGDEEDSGSSDSDDEDSRVFYKASELIVSTHHPALLAMQTVWLANE